MKLHRIIVGTIVVLCLPLISAESVHVGDTGITFDPPEGFQPLSQEVIDTKWPSSQRPRYAIGNESASTTVAYDIKSHEIPSERLDEARKAFTQVFERIIPGLEWKRNEIIALSDVNWIYMELTSRAIDTDIYNIVLVTGYRGKMLTFNFNSTRSEFPKYEKALRASLSSIKLPEKQGDSKG